MDLSLTPQAEKFIRRMLRFGGVGAEGGFRLCVSPGGCSGLNAEFSVEKDPQPGDAVVVHNGFRLFLPAQSRALLEGVTIDFVDTPMSSGFVFHDPKATNCGTCGSATLAGSAAVPLTSIRSKSGQG
jgi:iron-sulfur cluster assembly accessory protein